MEPKRIAALPHHGAFPVPFSVLWVDGKPDFRQTDMDKAQQAIRDDLCWVCGDQNGYWKAFIGGPLSIANRLFNDGPMHLECAEYAIQTCPFLLGTRDYRPEGMPEDRTLPMPPNPGVFGLGITRAYALVDVRIGPGQVATLIRAAAFKKLTWYRGGIPGEPPAKVDPARVIAEDAR